MRPSAIDTSRRPFVIVWELTQACDLACKHCRADAQPNRHPNELSTAEGKRLLEQIAEFGEDQLVVFSGGDPMARSDTIELVRYGLDQGLELTITPSGTQSLTADHIAELAESGIRRMALSIDGATPDAHDEFRGEAGSFAETMRAAEHVRAVDIPLQINTTVCQETVDELPGICDLVNDLDAVLWSVFFLVPVGRGAVLTPISPKRAESVMHWLHQTQSSAGIPIKTTEAPFYRRVSLQQEMEAGEGSRLGRGIIAGDGFAFVSHIGELYPSGFLPQSAGNVRDEHVAELYRESPLFAKIRDRDQLVGKCGSCPYRHICGGSRSRAYAWTGNPLESDPLCPFIPTGYDGPLPLTIE